MIKERKKILIDGFLTYFVKKSKSILDPSIVELFEGIKEFLLDIVEDINNIETE